MLMTLRTLTRNLLESGANDGSSGKSGGEHRTLPIPSTLQDSLVARLDRLGPAKSTAQIASVIGREFNFELLEELSPLDRHSLSQTLGTLEHSELIHRRGDGFEAIFVFRHALLQDAAYASLLKSRRAQLHAEIARILESRFPQRVAEAPE